MTEEVQDSPTADERMLGALAHLFGIVGALIIWAIQKDKSRFVRFQAVQALAFDVAVMLFTGVLFFCLFAVIFAGMFGTMFVAFSNSSSENFAPFVVFPFMFPFLMFACISPVSLAILAARIIATLSVFSGNDFRYPLLGIQVEKFLAG